MEIFLTETWKIVKVRKYYVLKQTKLSCGTGKNIGKVRMIEVDHGSSLTIPQAINNFIQLAGDELTEDYKGDLKGFVVRLENIHDENYKRFCKLLKGAGYGGQS